MSDSDWREQAPPKARDALARDLQDSIRPSTLQALRSALDSCTGPDLFNARPGAHSDTLGALRRERALTPPECRLLDHVESHLGGLNSLNRDEIVAQSFDSLVREQLEAVASAIELHVARESFRDVPEARRRLGVIASTIDAAALSRDLAAGELHVAPRTRPQPIDIEHEDLRPESKHD